jgi:hypothetical protein
VLDRLAGVPVLAMGTMAQATPSPKMEAAGNFVDRTDQIVEKNERKHYK